MLIRGRAALRNILAVVMKLDSSGLYQLENKEDFIGRLCVIVMIY